jgi:hypothetical protein
MKRILLFWLLLVWFTNDTTAQSIRKDYREMTGAEMNDYVEALNTMRSTGMGNNPANHHGASNWIDFFGTSHDVHFLTPIHTVRSTNGTIIHNGRWFLPWHRVFLLEYERVLKQLSGKNYLSIPYWDSRNDANTGSTTFWHNGFLAPNRLNWSISREFGVNGQLASASTVDNVLNQTTLINANGNTDNFSRYLEITLHNQGHNWIGGTMGSRQSPLDPVFFLHHCMVDKLWDDWEERTPWTQSNITLNGGNGETMIHYNGTSDGYRYTFSASQPFSRTIPLPVYSNENEFSRWWDTWYSDYSSRSVVLHGYGPGLAFDIADYNPYTYRYVSATSPGGSSVTGHIHAGDITRSGGNVVASNDWGGVRVINNASCEFLAGGSVQFWPGFEAAYGTNVSAKIITTHSGARQSAEGEQSAFSDSESESLILFPNPTQGILNLKIPLSFKGEINTEILDIMGNTLISKSSEPVSSEISMDVNGLKTGLYFCRIFSENGQSKTGKFIKE